MISDITGIHYDLLKNNIDFKQKKRIKNELVKSNFLIEFDREDNIIISINKDSYARLLISNVVCIFMGIENKNDVDEDLRLIQIHLNYEDNCKKAISRYRITDWGKDGSYRSILCIEINPLKCREFYYLNKNVDNALKWGTIFSCDNIEMLKNILKEVLVEEEFDKLERQLYISQV